MKINHKECEMFRKTAFGIINDKNNILSRKIFDTENVSQWMQCSFYLLHQKCLVKEHLHNPLFRFFTPIKSTSCKRKFVKDWSYVEAP